MSIIVVFMIIPTIINAVAAFVALVVVVFLSLVSSEFCYLNSFPLLFVRPFFFLSFLLPCFSFSVFLQFNLRVQRY